MKLQFYLRFRTRVGQSLWICGDREELGNDDPSKALPMTYLNEEYWSVTLEVKKKSLADPLTYKYYLQSEEGEQTAEWGKDRTVELFRKELEEIQLIDTWNHAGEYENVFYTLPFKNVLFKHKAAGSSKHNGHPTHYFRVKAPLLQKK